MGLHCQCSRVSPIVRKLNVFYLNGNTLVLMKSKIINIEVLSGWLILLCDPITPLTGCVGCYLFDGPCNRMTRERIQVFNTSITLDPR